MVSEYKCKNGILSACESCKHRDCAANEQPCKSCLEERGCPYFKHESDCAGCRWEGVSWQNVNTIG